MGMRKIPAATGGSVGHAGGDSPVGKTMPESRADRELDSQNAAILADLQRGWRITSIDALEAYGCLRLSGRIYDLRQAGHPIVAEMIVTDSGKRVAEYRMEARG